MEHYLTILKDTVTSVKYAYDMYAGVSINLLPFYLALFICSVLCGERQTAIDRIGRFYALWGWSHL